MPRRLKVFRTATGFHDAYVAAPSRTAALKAWGATKNLFASEAAEEVTDPELIADVLARPGEVIRKPRVALTSPGGPDAFHAKAPAAQRKCREPSRAALTKAEADLAAFDRQAAEQLALLATQEAEIARKRRELESDQNTERAALERRRSVEMRKFARRLDTWLNR